MTEIEIGILEELNEILDRERAAILRGDIEQVGRIVESKEQLLEVLMEINQTEAENVQDLRQKLVRNQELLEHSLSGIRAVSQRLEDVRKTQTTLETYDSSGRRKTYHLPTSHKIEKHA